MRRSKRIWMSVGLVAVGLLARGTTAEPYIVKDGAPEAQIVIAAEPTRLVKLAAEELQNYLLKITGAELPIVQKRSAEYPVAIYVGQSAGTKALGIGTEGLAPEGFRVTAGPDWLLLFGRDADFEPVEPWARKRSDSRRAHAEWEKLYDTDARMPAGGFKALHRRSGIWVQDKSGSLQAVYEFLRDLGVRWYMPGELGEVVPQRTSIALPKVDKTLAPDFRVRDLRLGNVPSYSWEDFLWYWRLGLNSEGLGGAHGMRRIMSSKTLREKHPDYFALYGGKRMNGSEGGHAHVCFSHPGVKQEVLRYVRRAFDHYDYLRAFSIMPEDGYHHCYCDVCKDKSPSEVVWGFVDSVAREIYKTHPDRIVSCGAYASYYEPPTTIEKFSPNVVVRISWVRPGLDDDKNFAEYWNVVQGWMSKLAPGNLARNFNVQWSASQQAPLIFPHSIAREMAAVKGLAIGENSSVPRSSRDQRWGPPGLAHLNHYVTASYLRDADQDLDNLLSEYYNLFYGPAADEMRKAFEYAERVYSRDRKPGAAQPLETRIEFVKLLLAAREAAGNGVYGQRVQLVLDDLPTLEALEEALAKRIAMGDPRKDAPVILVGDAAADRKTPVYRLRDIKIGDDVDDDVATTFQVAWEGRYLVFDITCHEPDLENMPITGNVWGGDSVAMLIETPVHSYYHLEINPNGKVYDADRSRGRRRGMEKWLSKAEVTVERGDNLWRLLVRIPVVSVDEGADDPLHFVVGDRPTKEKPWYINVGRTRGLGKMRKRFAFSPTGGTFHHPLHFAKLMPVE